MKEKLIGTLKVMPFGWTIPVGLRNDLVQVGWVRDPDNPNRDKCVAWDPDLANVTEYDLLVWNGTDGPTWDIRIEEFNSVHRGEVRVRYRGTIYRNREKFLTHWYNDRNFAWNALNVKLSRIEEHPLGFKSDTFREDMAGRKVWFNDQPGVIDHWLGSDDLRLIIVPEKGTKFSCPKQFLKEELESGNNPDDYYEEGEVVTTIFDPQVWWFRDDDDPSPVEKVGGKE